MGCGTGSGHPFIFQAYCDINWRNREMTVRGRREIKKLTGEMEKKERH